jgi:hypothetical protein
MVAWRDIYLAPAASRNPSPKSRPLISMFPSLDMRGCPAMGIPTAILGPEPPPNRVPDPAEMAARYGADTAVLDWRGWPAYSMCRLHDLRRTLASGAAALCVAPEVVDK